MISFILLLAAFVCFVIGAADGIRNAAVNRVGWVSLGLAFCTVVWLIAAYPH